MDSLFWLNFGCELYQIMGGCSLAIFWNIWNEIILKNNLYLIVKYLLNQGLYIGFDLNLYDRVRSPSAFDRSVHFE